MYMSLFKKRTIYCEELKSSSHAFFKYIHNSRRQTIKNSNVKLWNDIQSISSSFKITLIKKNVHNFLFDNSFNRDTIKK